MPLAPDVLQGKAVLHHAIVQVPVVRIPVGLGIAAHMIFLLVEAVAGKLCQILPCVDVFPLSAGWDTCHPFAQLFAKQGFELFGNADKGCSRFQNPCPVHLCPVPHRRPEGQPARSCLADPAHVCVKAPLKTVVLLPAPKVDQTVVNGALGCPFPIAVEALCLIEGDGGEVKISEVETHYVVSDAAWARSFLPMVGIPANAQGSLTLWGQTGKR